MQRAGLPHFQGNPRSQTNVDRVARRAEVESMVAEAVASYDREPLLKLLDEADVPAAPVSTVDRVMQDPQVEHRQMVETALHSRLGEIKVIGTPLKFSAMKPGVRRAAPAYGEHTDEILREHGYTDAEITTLRAKGVVR